MKVFKWVTIDNVVEKRYKIFSNGKLFDTKYNKYLAGHINKGYLRVTLMQSDKKQKSYYIHVLVACMFHGDHRSDLTVNHKNGKLDNSSEQLEWLTYRENIKHAIDNNLIKNKKMTSESDVHEICRRLELGWGGLEISKDMNIKLPTVYGVRSGLNWVDISSKYNFSKRNPYIKLTETIVHKLCMDIKNCVPLSEISSKHNVNYTTLGSIKQGKTWRHISNLYL